MQTLAYVSIFLDIEPLPCPRPRIVVRGRFPSAYYPKSYTEWKASAEELLKEELNGRSFPEGALSVTLTVCCTKPKTTKLAFPKPDIDNYAKSVMDALTKAGAWSDDSQVVILSAEKQWTTGKAGVYITIDPVS